MVHQPGCRPTTRVPEQTTDQMVERFLRVCAVAAISGAAIAADLERQFAASCDGGRTGDRLCRIECGGDHRHRTGRIHSGVVGRSIGRGTADRRTRAGGPGAMKGWAAVWSLRVGPLRLLS